MATIPVSVAAVLILICLLILCNILLTKTQNERELG